MSSRSLRHFGGIVVAALPAGCRGVQSALAPAGTQAGRIATTWWLFFWITAVVFVLVIGFVGAALWRSRSDRRDVPDADPAAERRLGTGVGIAVALTVAILFVLLVASFLTGRRLAALARPSALTIQVTGHQWWWEVQYVDPLPANRFITANEIHVPVGRPVVLDLASADVIHSFWVPNLHGKRDLIPGYTTAFWIQADRPGVYRGQCAEFCGTEHALMAFEVVAEPEDVFDQWLAHQRQPAAEPGTEAERRGRDVFVSTTCVQCHAIRGTKAAASFGPDLTHLASRRSLAAATLPNTRGNLAGWIADPQSIKPGNHMPPNGLPPEDLQALLSYLQSLK